MCRKINYVNTYLGYNRQDKKSSEPHMPIGSIMTLNDLAEI
jgi:phosphoribosylpyrophosphate synthetase